MGHGGGHGGEVDDSDVDEWLINLWALIYICCNKQNYPKIQYLIWNGLYEWEIYNIAQTLNQI